MSLLELYSLENNPFSVSPSKESPFWADREKFKSDLEDAIRFTLQGTQSQIIACIYGDWGCGKTHAMTYFSAPTVLSRIAASARIPKGKSLFSIPTVFPTKDVLKTLYFEILHKHLTPNLGNALKSLLKEESLVKEGNLEIILKSLISDEDLAKVLSQHNVRGQTIKVQRYLAKSASRSDLDSLGVAKGIETNHEMLSTLANVLKLFTKTLYSRVFIWIDDCERLDEVPGREMFEFQYFLRDMLDLLPERLTFIVNFTLLPGEKIPERMTYLGPAVQNRISKIINVEYFNKDDYLKYIEALLSNSRKKTPGQKIKKYFPFTEECLLSLFEILEKSTTNLQPRTVNRVLSSLLEGGLRKNITEIDGKHLKNVRGEIELVMAS